MLYHFFFFAPPGDAAVATAFLRRVLPLLDMFFMISGFFLALRYGDRLRSVGEYGRFLRRRIARLYPLHILTLAIFVGIALLGSAGIDDLRGGERWDFSVIPLQILAVHAWGTTDHLAFNYPSWSVSAEIFCYLLFPVLLVTFRRLGLKGLVALCLAYVVGLEAASQAGLFPSGHWTTADTFGAFRAFADFQAGAIAALLVGRRVLDVRSHVPGLGVLALGLANMLAVGPVHLSLACLFAAIVLVGLSESARPQSTDVLKPLMPLTAVSFGIYLWHPVMEALFLSLLWNRFLGPTGAVSFYVVWTLPIVATIAVALWSSRFVEGPLGRRLGGSSERRPGSPAPALAGA